MIPTLTTEQRRENLEKAKAARQRRAAILKGVADGSYTVPDVLNMAFTDDAVSRMKVFTLIKGQTYGGKWVKAGSVRVTRHVLGVR